MQQLRILKTLAVATICSACLEENLDACGVSNPTFSDAAILHGTYDAGNHGQFPFHRSSFLRDSSYMKVPLRSLKVSGRGCDGGICPTLR